MTSYWSFGAAIEAEQPGVMTRANLWLSGTAADAFIRAVLTTYRGKKREKLSIRNLRGYLNR